MRLVRMEVRICGEFGEERERVCCWCVRVGEEKRSIMYGGWI